jgi:hypothetical protein
MEASSISFRLRVIHSYIVDKVDNYERIFGKYFLFTDIIRVRHPNLTNVSIIVLLFV